MRTLSLALALVALGLTACGGGAASLEFVELVPPTPRIGDVVTVRFRVRDYRGEPQAGVKVNFKLQSEKFGASLSPASASSLKGSGYAETQLVVSSRVSSVIVEASAGDKTVTSTPISIAGSVPNGRQFTFQCGEISGESSGGIHAIGAYDNSRFLIAGVKLNCIAHVGDRNGDGVPGALVSFMTEAGTIGPTEASVADVVGNAKILYKTSLPLPKDVGPEVFAWNPARDATHTGILIAPTWMEPYRWSAKPALFQAVTLQEPRRNDPVRKGPNNETLVNNPRDNLVAMIAVTSGEEGFTDSNNNGKYDNGEAFDDLTEPFVDADDNGTWDVDERFIDLNGDGRWNGANGQWDANTLIWVQERIIWTGMLDLADQLPPEPLAGIVSPANGIATVAMFGGFSNAVRLAFTDPWYNTPAENGEGDGCTAAANDFVKSVPEVSWRGARFTYPTIADFTMVFQDIRKLEKDQAGQTIPQPARTVSVEVSCKLTASPEEGHVVIQPLGNVSVSLPAYP